MSKRVLSGDKITGVTEAMALFVNVGFTNNPFLPVGSIVVTMTLSIGNGLGSRVDAATSIKLRSSTVLANPLLIPPTNDERRFSV